MNQLRLIALAALVAAALYPPARAAAPAAPRNAPAAGTWQQLAASRWIADGRSGAPRIVYVFTDLNCPNCTQFWADARPWVEAGKVQLRHVMVGILTPTSAGKAAALLAAADPAQALAAYERSRLPEAQATLASRNPQPLQGVELKPLDAIPPALAAQLEGNRALMAGLGLRGTPGLAWRDASGQLLTRSGAPAAALPAILGPR